MDSKQLERLMMQAQKPGRYSGGEPGSVVKDKNSVDVRFAFCFPDTYEVGMSHLGIKILYSIFNKKDYIWCERVFAPWIDFEEIMRENGVPLFALESRDSLDKFDIIGFTLQYELSYTNMLNMLSLGGIPQKSADRHDLFGLVVAGGPCVCNPEPVADFVDAFFLGEGEEVDLEFIDLYREYKKRGASKEEFLRAAAKIEGVYVPSLYDVDYNVDGTIRAVTPKDGAPAVIRKRIIRDLDSADYPEDTVVPIIEIIHDRAVEEIFRGCIRGCRFCQAGFIYRPVREKSPEVINRQARAMCRSTGYDELSLSSLSTSDYTRIEPLLREMLPWTEEEKINLSLPSLRIDNFDEELLEKVQAVKRSGLTFAPEAGTQRLRDVINKNICERDIIDSVRVAFDGGYTAVKLYFMIGLPTETDEDIEGIAELGQRIVNEFYNNPNKPKGRGVTVSISASTFVPKAFTPFQFEPQITVDEIKRRQKHLVDSVNTKKISLSWHDAYTSALEGVFARGDRRLGRVLERAAAAGCRFDGWSECFSYDRWMEIFKECEVDPAFYANRGRGYDEVLPWDHLDYGIKKSFFIEQDEKARMAVTTPNCREECSHCGAACFKGGVCVEKRADSI